MPPTELKCFISLHDVMPETLPEVQGILARLDEIGLPPITLLVVPGRDWSDEQIDWLRARSAEGHELAAHGWLHETTPKRLYHRLHAALISRNVAEHLALAKAEIVPFMQRSMAWFPEQGLPAPSFYVPPAWALGLKSRAFRPGCAGTGPEGPTPFPEYIEVLRGIIDVEGGQLHRLPLVGYEVDTWWRKAFVKQWNARNIRKAQASGRVLRIGLHPYDFKLLLADELEALLLAPNLTPLSLRASLGL
jgi:predicted deacetylase